MPNFVAFDVRPGKRVQKISVFVHASFSVFMLSTSMMYDTSLLTMDGELTSKTLHIKQVAFVFMQRSIHGSMLRCGTMLNSDRANPHCDISHSQSENTRRDCRGPNVLSIEPTEPMAHLLGFALSALNQQQ